MERSWHPEMDEELQDQIERLMVDRLPIERFTEEQRLHDLREMNRRFPVSKHDRWNGWVDFLNDGVGAIALLLLMAVIMFAFLVWSR